MISADASLMVTRLFLLAGLLSVRYAPVSEGTKGCKEAKADWQTRPNQAKTKTPTKTNTTKNTTTTRSLLQRVKRVRRRSHGQVKHATRQAVTVARLSMADAFQLTSALKPNLVECIDCMLAGVGILIGACDNKCALRS